MKVEILKTGLKLEPENEEDQAILDTLEAKGFEKIVFDDTWDNTGKLNLTYRQNA